MWDSNVENRSTVLHYYESIYSVYTLCRTHSTIRHRSIVYTLCKYDSMCKKSSPKWETVCSRLFTQWVTQGFP